MRVIIRSMKQSWKTVRRDGALTGAIALLGRWVCLALLLAVFVGFSRQVSAAESEGLPGLETSFTNLQQPTAVTDREVFEQLAIYVPLGDPVSPFVEVTEYSIEWNGFLSVPLRDDYRFRVLSSGAFELQVDGEVVLSHVGDGGEWSEPSEEVRLRKGGNVFKAVFKNNPQLDAVVRVEWSSPDFLFEPIAAKHWTHQPSEALKRQEDLRQGRALFVEHRCAVCHVDQAGKAFTTGSAPGLDLTGVGERRRHGWIKDWLLSPEKWRSKARMPGLFVGDQAEADVQAVTAFLVDQGKPERDEAVAVAGDAIAGKAGFEALHCAVCHQLDDASDGAGSDDLISLAHLERKFLRRDLVAFLRAPGRHYPEIRMPDFGLSAREAADLAAFLIKGDELPWEELEAAPELVARGRELVSERRCFSCHQGADGERKSLAAAKLVPIKSTNQGCLTDGSGTASNVPRFRLSDRERQTLRLVLEAERPSLNRFVAREAAQRQQENLRCTACHGNIQGIPPAEHFGGKLKPEWMNRLFRGDLFFKPRPWLAARMPAFPAYASQLAIGLSHKHGYAGASAEPERIDYDLADVGRQLVSPVGGFSCVSCHGVGDMKPTQVFESEGINFMFSGERLRREYFDRWILNPVRIDPATKMPVYFDESGESPLYDVLEGDSRKQLDAIWHYLLLGFDMDPPFLE